MQSRVFNKSTITKSPRINLLTNNPATLKNGKIYCNIWSFVIYERPILDDEPKPHFAQFAFLEIWWISVEIRWISVGFQMKSVTKDHLPGMIARKYITTVKYLWKLHKYDLT